MGAPGAPPRYALGRSLLRAGSLLRHPPLVHRSEVYVLLAAFSCLLITKDEFVHVQACDPREMWLHALLFVLHPIVFLSFGLIWWSREWHAILFVQLAVTLAFAAYQFIYWSFYADQHRPHSSREQRSLRDARGPLVRSDGRSDRAAPRRGQSAKPMGEQNHP